jgi:hypothetical protein
MLKKETPIAIATRAKEIFVILFYEVWPSSSSKYNVMY